MKRITRYILAEIAPPALLALAVLSVLAVANELRERMSIIPMTRTGFSDFSKLALWFLPSLIHYVVPVTFMMGVMMAFGRLAGNNEITAMRAAGIPLKRLILPVILTGAMLSSGVFLLQDRIQPAALKRANTLIYRELPRRITMDVLAPGVMHDFGSWSIYIGSKDPANHTLLDVDILLIDEAGELAIYHADAARLLTSQERPRIEIEKGLMVKPGTEGWGRIPGSFALEMPPPETMTAPGGRKLLSLRELWDANTEKETAILKASGLTSLHSLYRLDPANNPSAIPQGVSFNDLRDLYAYHDEIRERLSLPLACLAVSLVAAPLAARGREGGRTYSFAIGFGVCLVYYFLWMYCQPRTLCSLNEAIGRGMIPNAVMACAGVIALWRVDQS